ERLTARSADGTEVPITLISRGPVARDAASPALVYAYGGFNVSLTPHFAGSILAWLELGGVYAVANLRGGGEFGEGWHLAGTLADKTKVFDDLEAVLRHLVAERISRPARIGITGGSNGGLLVGAML